ncbi:MAG: hypothetical protein JO234_09405, partial [Hyphomicrobiales bacterium]|nr:hypothetical protein [Hyphomicrobiales bacterium]
LASTCLVVVFVPSFSVVLQRFEEWSRRRGQQGATPAAPGVADGAAVRSPDRST